ncbi:eukaryotic translation elongation factor 1 epsilon-1 isoform X1 [Phycodurus eques]|uniref:eukaryotic translation elongation factor 1 epsilon-1 isoform X1 n=1 Tax=Phycodurus eques TaxID=693459 RepID=UPI002ACE3995|nr:eukaryotic translation elongation factor 1 epsilon-1 isoform X1 [Phycodurus eques]
MALRELSSLEKYLGLKKPNKYSSRGDKKCPVLQNNNGPPLVGLVTIARHLVKEAKCPEMLGETAEDRAVVHQWLEYRVSKLDGCSKDDSRAILKAHATAMQTDVWPFSDMAPHDREKCLNVPNASQREMDRQPRVCWTLSASWHCPVSMKRDLNLYLQDKVCMAGDHFTLADVLMYNGIHPLIVDLTFQEKEQYMNVTRWFDHIQHRAGIRHHLPRVVVLRNKIYTCKHH